MSDLIPQRGLDQPFERPIQWKDWEAKAGAGVLPYATPEDEYLHNIHAPSLNQLMYRWEGYGFEHRIHCIFHDPTMPMQRAKKQQIRKRAAGIPDLLNPEDMKIDRAYNILICQTQIEQLQWEIENGVEKVVETTGDLMTGLHRDEVWRPLTSRNLTDKRKELREWIKFKMTLQGEATEIVENRSNWVEQMMEHAAKLGIGAPNGTQVFESQIKDVEALTVSSKVLEEAGVEL